MEASSSEAIGILGGFITSSAILPQLYKSYKHGATKDLSWSAFVVFYVGFCFNLAFGLMIRHPAVYLTALYSFFTNTTLLVIKYYYEVVCHPCHRSTQQVQSDLLRPCTNTDE